MTVTGGLRTGAPAVGTPPRAASPVTAPVRIVGTPRRADDGSLSAATVCTADPDEAFFAGHYPGFPIFPGVCVIECVHRSALLVLPSARLAAIESARFRGPVLPGDELSVELALTADSGTGGDDAWRVAATVRTIRGTAATVRLRLTSGGLG
ncbi:3-hydroxyacyl-ACP dehydratase FabZ family protein [Streptomyces fimicarius]|uniref:3-hydroxyacyl-ACP dehydratase FabZ family protein n=1 Tax=Streptomyces griseus TaxID=1911 RepID=UPI0036CC93B2